VTKLSFHSLSGGTEATHELKVIFFDAAGTLFHLPRGVGWHYRDVALRHGWDLSEDRLRSAFGTVWREMPVRPAVRGPRAGDDKSWWRELVERVLDQCGAEGQGTARDAYFEELYREFTLPGVWELYPEVTEVLAALRPRFRLGVISNFDGRLRAILDHLGIFAAFDPVVISSEVGADKPDAWIFEQALARAGAAPGEAWHVGDDPERDWQGAAAAGLHVFRLSRPENSLRDLHALLEERR
jgi:putative hydrolase of the HAD superfamily